MKPQTLIFLFLNVLCLIKPCYADDGIIGYPQSVPYNSFVEISVKPRASQEHPGHSWRQRIIVSQGNDISALTIVKVFEFTPPTTLNHVFVPNDNNIYYKFQQFYPAANEWRTYSRGDVFYKSDNDSTETRIESEGAEIKFIWGEKIRNFAVRVKTRDKQDAGTDNQVWFDAGFKAWDLEISDHNDFESGSNDTYQLALPAGIDFYVDDIIEARLEKKGIGQWTASPDGPGGGWEPESVTLIINGRDWLAVNVPAGIELDHNRPAWRQKLRILNEGERFAWGLRTEINDETGRVGEIISGFTTVFKQWGISGWQRGPVREEDPQMDATAIGVLRHRPSAGTDGFVSLDLELQSVNAQGTWYNVNDWNDVPHPRYIRIEYDHKSDERYKSWNIGDAFQITGEVKWDTDKGGFYEIHPRGAGDVIALVRRNPLLLRSASDRARGIRASRIITRPTKAPVRGKRQ